MCSSKATVLQLIIKFGITQSEKTHFEFPSFEKPTLIAYIVFLCICIFVSLCMLAGTEPFT